jgi:hypothetical protein
MYQNKLAVAIKTAGKVLREQGDKVFLPFGSEYSIFVKNLNSVRALVRISLDGESVTDGEDLVVQGNDEMNLERFLKKGNLNQGHKFKFIERTGKIEQHRGVGIEDGLLRIEFRFEKVIPAPVYVPTIPYITYNPSWHYSHTWPVYGIGIPNMASITNSVIGSANTVCAASSYTPTASAGAPIAPNLAQISRSLHSQSLLNSDSSAGVQSLNDAGITVPGSISSQQFHTAAWFAVEDEKHVIVLKLVGDTGQGLVEKPILVQKKQTCGVCNTRNRGQNKFCRECGASLLIL